MPNLEHKLEVERCPHCSVHKPNLTKISDFETKNHRGGHKRFWVCYFCQSCGGAVLACAPRFLQPINEIYPMPEIIDDCIPERAKNYLDQAIGSIHTPAGSVMLAASAVDAMFKAKDYKKGSLYSRIKLAVKENLITKEMETWAHEVRLDANDQRHSDESVELPNEETAKKVIDFTLALAEFLFVLPSRVERGIEDSST